ncbi:MAG: SBBP repeat-containing protein [Ignavibacteria bacterium]|nr:SBBP repeat-containing protein [Ignavibacteria bacterium]
MKTDITFIILSLLLTLNLKAQVTQQWVANYNGPGNSGDFAESIVSDGSGNVYVTGESYRLPSTDYATIKYNSAGIQQWVAIYTGPGIGSNVPVAIVADGSGNVYVTGYSYGGETGIDYATIKYNSSGDSVWVKRYNGTGNSSDYTSSIALDSSGNVYVTGTSIGNGTNFDYVTIKYNSVGVQQWVARYNGPGNSGDYANSIAADDAGNVYVTGSCRDNTGLLDYATVKYNSEGVQQWVSVYTGPINSDEKAESISVDNAGNVCITGSSEGTGISYYATIKYNSEGVQQWVARYENGAANSIALDGAGNVYVTGFSNGIGTSNDYATIKYNPSGIQQWVTRYNGPGNSDDRVKSLALDGSGNVYVTGSSDGYATIKYNSDGIQQWVARDDNGAANSIALDGAGNVYVTGSGTGIGGTDYKTIKYSQSVGISQISSGVPEIFFLSQNYPNPFNPTTSIEFSLPENSFVKLKVIDITGKEVSNLVNENFSAGTFRYEFNGKNLPSGVYYYKLETGNFSQTKKMLLIK